jgi:hypothetical protein
MFKIDYEVMKGNIILGYVLLIISILFTLLPTIPVGQFLNFFSFIEILSNAVPRILCLFLLLCIIVYPIKYLSKIIRIDLQVMTRRTVP